MPVVLVFAPAAVVTAERLTDVCSAVSEALGLPADGVVASHVPTAATVQPGVPDATWPVVVIHGSARDAGPMQAAVDSVETVVRAWSPQGEAWVTWQLPWATGP